MANVLSDVRRRAGDAFPTAVGVTAGAVAAGLGTGLVRKVGPFGTPGLLYDYGAPTLSAAAALLAGVLLGNTKFGRSGFAGRALGGFYAGPLVALLMHLGAKWGVRGFQTNTGTAGVGILVAEETAPLEAIIAEADAEGFALAALDDGTLAEIVVEGGAQGHGVHGLMDGQGEEDSDDDSDDGYEGTGNVDVSSGGVGSVDVSSGGVGGFAGSSGWGAW